MFSSVVVGLEIVIMRFVIEFVAIFSTVFGDMCQDMCIRALGLTGCAHGSWCQNNQYCHALFWTSADRTGICVYSGALGPCPNMYPVFCREANARVTSSVGISSTSTSRITTSTTTTAKAIAPGTTTTASTRVTTRATTRATAGIATRFGILGSSIVFATLSSYLGDMYHGRTGSPNYRGRIRPISLSTRYMRTHRDYVDPRPRIFVIFPAMDKRISHLVSFDTGSDRSFMLLGHKGYRATAPGVGVIGQREILVYGTDASRHEYSVVGKQVESVRLNCACTGVYYTTEITVDLVSHIPPGIPDIGLFGASPSSEFARSVGVFIYDPHPYHAGTIVIGEPPPLCPSGRPMHYDDLLPGLGVIWAVPGLIAVGTSPSQAVDWSVDTGATGFFILPEMFELLVQEIRSLGSAVMEEPGQYPIISNCNEYRTRFPPIHYTIGADIRLRIEPTDYIMNHDTATGSCVANVVSDGFAEFPRLRLLSIEILRKLDRTVFDARNSRMGFCASS